MNSSFKFLTYQQIYIINSSVNYDLPRLIAIKYLHVNISNDN